MTWAARKLYKAHLAKSPLRQQPLRIPKPQKVKEPKPTMDIMPLLPCPRDEIIEHSPIGKNATLSLLAQLRRDKVIMYDGGVVRAYEVADVSDCRLE